MKLFDARRIPRKPCYQALIRVEEDELKQLILWRDSVKAQRSMPYAIDSLIGTLQDLQGPAHKSKGTNEHTISIPDGEGPVHLELFEIDLLHAKYGGRAPCWIHVEDGSLCNSTIPIGQRYAMAPYVPNSGALWWCSRDQKHLFWTGR